MDAIHKILVPTDFSAHADEAFRVACTLARATGATVIVFHIVQTPTVVSEKGPLLVSALQGQPANLWDRFQTLQPADSRVNVEHQVIVADRPSARQILDILDRLGCDLIVMGTHGRSWLKQRLFGSVTEEVVRRARCPVMVVEAPNQSGNQAAPEPAPGNGTEK